MCVLLRVIASQFFTHVQLPVGVEVAVYAKCSQTQHGFGSGEGPACTAAVHSVLDQMATCALDDARRDGQPLLEGLAVAHVAGVVLQVVRGFTNGFERAAAEPR